MKGAMSKGAAALTLLVFLVLGCGKADPQDLAAQLQSADAEVRKTAAFKLADYGADAVVAVPALMRALDDEDGDVVIWSMHALGEIGPGAKAAVPALQQKLNDKDWNIRNLAKFALERIGADSVPAIIDQLRSDNRDKRKEGADLLMEIGKRAVPALRNAASDKDYKVRFWVAHVLGEVDPDSKETLEIMNTLRNDKSKDVRDKALEVLGKIGKSGIGTTQ